MHKRQLANKQPINIKLENKTQISSQEDSKISKKHGIDLSSSNWLL